MAAIDLTESAARLAIAAVIGLAIGTEREWSGPRGGLRRRFAGLRTFLAFGIIGGVAGLLFVGGAAPLAVTLIGAGAALIVVAYGMSTRRPDAPLDGTTEAAGLAVLALGALATVGQPGLASATAALLLFALGEKRRLHWMVRRIGAREMHAALQFLVLALVVLPLLPAGPIGGALELRPRLLWGVVLILLAINFASYLARRALGPGRGYGVTGALAGVISSTVLTLQFARLSRQEPGHGDGLALGTIAASAVLPLRILLVSTLISPVVALALAPLLGVAVVVALLLLVPFRRALTSAHEEVPEPRNPLRLASALEMAAVFAVVFIVVDLARARWGSGGVVVSSVLAGLADLDALTVSLSRQAVDAGLVHLAAQGIGVGLLANTLTKLVLAVGIGTGEYRRRVGLSFAALAVSIGAGLWLTW